MRHHQQNSAYTRRAWASVTMRVILLSLLWLAPMVASSAPAQARTPLANDLTTLFVAYNAAPQTLDPAAAYDFGGPVVLRGCYDSLVTLEGGSISKVIGDLATRWTSSPDQTVWTFYLHHGVHFHDGTPLTADAVKFTYDRLLSVNQGPAYIIGQFLTPARIHVLDPYTIQFNLLPHSPVYAFLQALTAEWSNWIVSPTAIKKHTVHNDQAQGWLSTHEAGSGPYVLAGYQLNQSATLTAFPGYWKGWSGSHLRRVIITNVTQDATRRELLEKGDADISLSFTPQDLLAMQKESGLVVGNRYVLLEVFISMTEFGPLASAKARQAMAYAYDYQSFVRDILKGFGKQAAGPLPSTVSGHDAALQPYRTDLNKARALLKEAGVASGTTMTLVYQAGDERSKQMSEVLQGQLAQLGINLKLQARDTAAFYNLVYSAAPAAQRPNFVANFWEPDYNDPIDYLSPNYHSRGNTPAGGANAGNYSNAQVDTLLAQAAGTLDAAKRQAILNRIQDILTFTDPAAIYVADATDNPVWRSNLHGYVINPELSETYDYYNLWKS